MLKPLLAVLLSVSYLSPVLINQAGSSHLRQSVTESKTESKTDSSLTLSSARAFRQSLQKLAEQYQVLIIAEGSPLEETKNREATRNIAFTLPDALQELGEQYDYNVVHPSDRVYLLSKRYSDPADLPVVTFGECYAALSDIHQLVTANSPYLSLSEANDLLEKEIVSELTPDKIGSIWEELPVPEFNPYHMLKKVAIPVTQLPEAVQEKINHYSRYILVQKALDKTDDIRMHLKTIREPRSTFYYKSKDGLNLFGYEGWIPADPKPYFFPLSHSAQVDIIGFGAFGVWSNSVFAHPEKETDATEPTAEDFALSKQKSEGIVTLQELTERLNAQKSGAEYTCTIDPILASKTITIAGEKWVDALTTMNGIADIFALQVLKINATSGRTTTYHLKRRRLPVLKSTLQLPQILPQVIPPAFFRFRQASENYFDAHKEVAAAKISSISSRRSQQFELVRLRKEAVNSTLQQQYNIAMRQMRARIDLLLKQKSEGKLLIRETDEKTHDLLAIALMSKSIEEISQFIDMQLPRFLETSDDSVVVLEWSKAEDTGQPIVGFTMARRTTDGKFANEGFISGARYYGPLP